MEKNNLGTSVFLISLILLSFTAFADDGKAKVRVVAHNDKEISGALEKNCKQVKKVRELASFECDENDASVLGLQADVKFFAVDSNANAQIGANTVHSSGNTGSGARIVVLDSGYNYNHRELSSSYLGGWDFVNNDSNPSDDNGHGTHVGGIITSDGIDPRSKGASPGAGIIAGKVLDAGGSGYFSDIVDAIYWAVDGPDRAPNTGDEFNATAISMSIGTSAPYLYKGYCDGALPELTDAIKYARSRGVLVLVAAGNSGSAGVSIPGCINASTTVGAVDGRDRIASFSGKGQAVDITAPGVNIYSTWLGTGYKTLSGTSMATPMISGVAALIKTAHPGFTADQVEAALLKTAKDLGKSGWDSSYGWGRVNANKAVNYTG